MTIHGLIDRLTQLISWLYYQHRWAEWELLAIAVAALVPLLLIARQHRKEKAGRGYARQIQEPSPIIGVKLANGKQSRQEVADTKKSLLARSSGKYRRERTTTHSDGSSEQIRQLRDQIAERRQAEAKLEQRLTQLTAASEKLQCEITERKQAEGRLKQQIAELLAVNERLQQRLARRNRLGEFLKKQSDRAPAGGSEIRGDAAAEAQTTSIERQAADIPAAQGLSRDGLHHPEQHKRKLTESPKQRPCPRLTREPLDVEKLKAIAALAKQIQQRPRRE